MEWNEDSAVDSVGRRIRARRQAKGWTQEQLAAAAGVHPTYLGGIERGTRNPSLRNLLRVAAALGVELARLVADDESCG